MRRRTWAITSGVCLVAAVGLGWLCWKPVAEGIESMCWPSAPAEILVARYRSEYDPEATSGADHEVRRTSADFVLAYAVPTPAGTQYFETRRFDTFGARTGDDGITAGEACEVRAVMAAGDRLRVYYDPSDPSRSVVHPGIPHYSMGLLLVPWTLFGFGLGCLPLAWAARECRTADSSQPHPVLGPCLWAALFPVAAFVLVMFLRPVSVWILGTMVPAWIVPAFFVATLLAAFLPRAVWQSRLFGYPALAVVLAVPLLLAVGIVATFAQPSRFGFRHHVSLAETVSRLDSPNPHVAEWAAWQIMRREGPREAVPALRRLLDNPQADTRRAAISALTRVGIAALPALGDLEAAAAEPRNEKYRSSIQHLITRLENAIKSRERMWITLKDLDDPTELKRNAAAFSLGFYGELAVPILPDLERALEDPRNANIAVNIRAAIHRIHHAQHAHDGWTKDDPPPDPKLVGN